MAISYNFYSYIVERENADAFTTVYEDVALYANLRETNGVKIIRLESSIFFGNAEATRDALVAEVGIDFVKAKKRRRKRSEAAAKTEAGRRRRAATEEAEDERIGASDMAAILTEEEEERGGEGEEDEEVDVDFVIVDCGAVTFTDYVGVNTLGQIVKVRFVGCCCCWWWWWCWC